MSNNAIGLTRIIADWCASKNGARSLVGKSREVLIHMFHVLLTPKQIEILVYAWIGSTTINLKEGHSGFSDVIRKEPLIPKDQSQISVERSTGPSPVIGTHTLTHIAVTKNQPHTHTDPACM